MKPSALFKPFLPHVSPPPHLPVVHPISLRTCTTLCPCPPHLRTPHTPQALPARHLPTPHTCMTLCPCPPPTCPPPTYSPPQALLRTLAVSSAVAGAEAAIKVIYIYALHIPLLLDGCVGESKGPLRVITNAS